MNGLVTVIKQKGQYSTLGTTKCQGLSNAKYEECQKIKVFKDATFPHNYQSQP